jgi:uncharacterized protein (DUF433 family)
LPATQERRYHSNFMNSDEKKGAVDSLVSRITITPGLRSGQPCIRDLRITVWDILKWPGTGASFADR